MTDIASASDLTSAASVAAAVPQLQPARGAASSVAQADQSSAAEPSLLSERWPTLAVALGQYEHNVAETFTREAYDCVEMGLLRFDARRALAGRAETLGIRPFDAQLLIACAIRKWSLDHQYEPLPSLHAPKLSYEYALWKKVWLRFTLVTATAIVVDYLVIMAWLR